MKKRALSGIMAGLICLSSTAFAGVSPIDHGADTSKYFPNATNLEYVAKPEFRAYPEGKKVTLHDAAYTFMLAEGNGVSEIDARKHFIVLDEFDMQDGSGKKEYLVMTYEGYGLQKFDEDPSYGKFDPTRPQNIGYRLNSPDGTFTTDLQRKVGEDNPENKVSHSLMSDEGWISEPYLGEPFSVRGEDGYGGFTLPKSIRDYINTEHEWQNDGCLNNPEPYTFKAGITLPSYAEMEKYMGIYGVKDNVQGLKIDGQHACVTYGGNGDSWGADWGEVCSWMLRTTMTEEDKKNPGNDTVCLAAVPMHESVNQPWGDQHADHKKVIRPIFCLTEDFFKNVKLNVSKGIYDDGIAYNANGDAFRSGLATGPAVREIMRKYNTEADLRNFGYTEDEINLIVPGLENQKWSRWDSLGAKHYTDEEYIFKLADSDKKFVLLDEEDDTHEMFVITYDTYGTHKYYTGPVPENNVYMDYEQDGKIYKWLENEFLTEGNTSDGVTYKLPDGIINHLVQSTWYSEPGTPWDSKYKYTQKATARISLLSETEWKRYNHFLGARDNFGNDDASRADLSGWFIRTAPIFNAGNNLGYVRSTSVKSDASQGEEYPIGAVARWWYNTSLLVRPCFFLDNEFVLSEKLDTEALGMKVKEYIRKYYTRDQFKALTFADGSSYSEKEITDIFGKPIEITKVELLDENGNALTALTAGKKVKVVYTINNNGDSDREMTAIIACYDKTAGTMKSAGCSSIENVPGGAKAQTVTAFMQLPSNVDNLRISAYLWDSLNGMTPVEPTKPFEV